MHSLTGRTLPKSVRDRLHQSTSDPHKANVLIKDSKKRPGFMSILGDSYLASEDTVEADPTLQKNKYKGAYEKIEKILDAPRSSTPSFSPYKSELSSLNVSEVPHHQSPSPNRALGSNTDSDRTERMLPVFSPPLRSTNQSLANNSSASQNGSSMVTSLRASGAKSKAVNEANDSAAKKNRSSAILARAAFWDARVEQGIASDHHVSEEFPFTQTEANKR